MKTRSAHPQASASGVEASAEPGDKPAGQGWFIAAAVFATLHAAPSLYWASGGRALVWTIGDWAVEIAAKFPVAASLGLLAVGLAKLAAGAIPLLNNYGVLPGRRIWERVILVGSSLLTLYGLANTVVGGMALLGWFGPLQESNRRALMGHVYLWDPPVCHVGVVPHRWHHQANAFPSQLQTPELGDPSNVESPRALHLDPRRQRAQGLYGHLA